MGNITLTTTFANATTADATEVNQNFTDILNVVNGSIDGTNIDSTSAITAATLSLTGALTSTLAIGTAPFTITSTTKVTNLNADQVDGVEAAAMNQLAVDQTIASVKTYDEGAVVHAPKTYTPAGAATATLDLSLGNYHQITMPAGNITIAISNETVGQFFIIDITQDSVGSRTVTWFSTISWYGQSAPTLTTTASRTDTFGFIVTGTDAYLGVVIGQNA